MSASDPKRTSKVKQPIAPDSNLETGIASWGRPLINDLDGARWTIKRIAEIQTKMSQCMDECLAEFRALVPGPDQQQMNPMNQHDNLSAQTQEDLPRFMENGPDSQHEH